MTTIYYIHTYKFSGNDEGKARKEENRQNLAHIMF